MRFALFVHAAALLALLALSPTTALAAPVPADHGCMGPWVGEGRNTGASSSWTIDLTMTSSPHGGRCGTIEYRNPDCGGTLENCRLVGQDIHTQERYTHNDGSCAPAGRVIIRCEGATMRYSWIGWEQVDSTLRRPEGWQPAANPSPNPTPNPSPNPSPSPTPTPSPTPNPAQPSIPAQPQAEESGFGCAVAGVGIAASPLLFLPVLLFVKRRRARRR